MGAFAGTSRFQILRELGAGGMGVVYEALDRERNEHVALKTLHDMEADALFRFKKEFRALHGIEHPNLVRLGELVEHEGIWFFTMELIDGEDFLSHVWTKDWRAIPSSHQATVRGEKPAADPFAPEPAPPAEPVERAYEEGKLRGALLQLAAGIQAVHDAGKVHRDIKPSNVSVARDGRVVLMDFGLITGVEQHDRSTVAGLCGTPQYMAPEQISVGRAEPAADWYAFGVMLYEALTARLPVDGTPVDIMVDKLRLKPVPPSSFMADVPSDLEDLCLDLLQIEPSARPTGPQVRARLGGAAAVSDPRRQEPSSAPLLIGRPAELGALERAWEICRRERRAQTVFVGGPSGMGKSALLTAFRRHLQALHPDAVVLEGRGYEHETIPYNVFDHVIDAISRLLRSLPADKAAELMPRNSWLLPRLFPVLGRVGAIGKLARSMKLELSGQELRTRCFGAFRELLARIAERKPLVVLLDDMQWAGRDSLMLLGEIVRPPDPPPMLLVLASREQSLLDPSPAASESAERWWAFPEDVTRVALGPLQAEDARALASHLIERAGDHRLDPAAVAEEAAGHPLFVHELVRYATVDAASSSSRPRLDDAIRARAKALPAKSRDVLDLAVVSGARVNREVLAAAAGIDALELARELATLERAHLIRCDAAVEAFHNRVSEALLVDLAPARRRECHARLAAAHERFANADKVLLTRHLHGAGQDARAAKTAVLAAEDAEHALAFDRAAELYRLALDLGGSAPDRALRVKLAESLALAGRSLEAADAYAAASEGCDRATMLDLQGLAARQYVRAGQFDRGMALARDVLAWIGIRLPGGPVTAVIRALWLRLVLRLRGLRTKVRPASSVGVETTRRLDFLSDLAIVTTGADAVIGTWLSTRTLLEALRVGEPSRLARAVGFEAGWVAAGIGASSPRVERLVALVNDMAARAGGKSAWPAMANAIVDFGIGRYEPALAKFTEGRATFAEQPGTRFELAMVDAFSSLTLHFLGRIGELRTLSAASLRIALDEGDRYHSAFHRLGPCNAAGWLAVDQPERAADEVRVGLASWSRDRFDLIACLGFVARVEIALYSTNGEDAWREIEACWKPLTGSMLLLIRFMRAWCFDLRGRAALALAAAVPARREEMLGEVTRALKALESPHAPTAKERAHLLRAGLSALRGDVDGERRELEAAIAGFDALGMGAHAAVARRRLGALEGGDAGAARVKAADAWLRAQQIARPDRWAGMLAPRPTPARAA